MRGFFLLLLLTNVAFVVWQYQKGDVSAQPDIYSGVDFSRDGLTLLDELPTEDRPALREGVEPVAEEPVEQETPREASAVETASVEGEAKVCLRVSNLEDKAALDKLIGELQAMGATALQQGSEQSKKINYWVMLPPYNSRDKASEAATILKQKRVRDFFIVRSGDYENAVSLGVFSTEERARRRYDEIVALKARLRRPAIESIELPAKRYWLSFELADKGRLLRAESLLEQLGQAGSEEIRCK